MRGAPSASRLASHVTDRGQKHAAGKPRLERLRCMPRLRHATEPRKSFHTQRLAFFRQSTVLESPRVLADRPERGGEILPSDRAARQT